MSTNLEDELRVAFDELAATTSITAGPRLDELGAHQAGTRRRPWLAVAVAAACVLLVAGLVVVARERTHDAVPLNTAPATVAPRAFLFPDAVSTTRYTDPREALDAYLADRVTTAPAAETVTYTVSSAGPPFDGSPDRVLIGFSLTVTPDDPELCCDSGDGVAYVEQVDDAWFVTSAEINAMQVHTLGYSDDGVVFGAISPTIGGTYTVTIDGFGAPGPELNGAVIEHEPDPDDPTNGPNFRLPGFTAPAVAVRIWQSPSEATPYPAAMFAEFIVPRGASNVATIALDPVVPATTAPSPDDTALLVPVATTSPGNDVVEVSPSGVPVGAIEVDEPLGPGSIEGVFGNPGDVDLTLALVGGRAYAPELMCSRFYLPVVTETDERVGIDVATFQPPQVGNAAVSCAVFDTVHRLPIVLSEALGQRQVVVQGEIIAVTPDPAGTGGLDIPISDDDLIHSGRLDVLAIGDSVMLGAADVLAARGYVVNANPSRQASDVVPLLHQLTSRVIDDQSLVVVHLGNNGPIDDATLDDLLAAMSEVPNVILINDHVDRSWAASNNELLASRDQPGDNIILIDWNTLADQCPGDCFTADGIHLTNTGQRYFADTIGDITGF